MNVLVVEDDPSVCMVLELFLANEGYQPSFVNNGVEAYERFLQGTWDLLIVDWMLPDMDGIALCRRVREMSNVPIILLTAKSGEADQVIGLEMGADDYVTKPFSPLALMARIKAVLRRCRRSEETVASSGAAAGQGGGGVGDGGSAPRRRVVVNRETREVWIDGKPVTNLTPKEFDLLALFAAHPKRVFTRQELLDRVWGPDFYGDERTVDVHIKRLRKKIAQPGCPWIHTVWGVGYRFDETEVSDEKDSAV